MGYAEAQVLPSLAAVPGHPASTVTPRVALSRPPSFFPAGSGGRDGFLREPDPCPGQRSAWGEGIRPADVGAAFRAAVDDAALRLLRGHRLLAKDRAGLL
jgi:hypothetical protein